MQKAKDRNFAVDNNLIKPAHVDIQLRYQLLELRCHGAGARLFFIYRENESPCIAVGGFYQKGQGISQDKAIKNAAERLSKYLEKN